jgi:hypothetical protein
LVPLSSITTDTPILRVIRGYEGTVEFTRNGIIQVKFLLLIEVFLMNTTADAEPLMTQG